MPFRTVEEITSWRSHEHDEQVYDLSHLNAHYAEYLEPQKEGLGRHYQFIVTYSMHCFTTKDYQSKTVDSCGTYSSHKETRLFNKERYELSKGLRGIIESLGSAKVVCFHTGHGSFATIKVLDVDYFIVFKVFKEKKRLRLHVLSAYPLDRPYGRIKKINFFTIAYNTLANKRIRSP